MFRSAAIALSVLIGGIASAQTPPNNCGASADADIVVMMDRTAGVSNGDMTQQKAAVKQILNFFSVGSTKPRISIGTYNVTGGADARILAHLTDVYGNDLPGHSGLYKTINDAPNNGTGHTDLSAAIAVAQEEIETNGTSATNRFIILVSNGITDEPDASDPGDCSNGNPGAAASAAADAADAAGIDIFTVHWSDDGECPAGTGPQFLAQIIASSPNHYFEGEPALNGIFSSIARAIVCDDNIICSEDTCVSNQCEHNYDPADDDGDGVVDCLDQCPGADDSLLQSECSAGVGACAQTGALQCECLNPSIAAGVSCSLVCDAKPGDPTAELCNGIDDDCDELIDEEFPVGESCVVGVGACVNNGLYACANDGSATCDATPGEPAGEVCDLLDNDCDGVVDEVFDICGVQCGDSSSCDCTEVNYTTDKMGLDSNSQEIFNITKKIGNRAKKLVAQGKGKPGLGVAQANQIVSNILAKLSVLHNSSWSEV